MITLTIQDFSCIRSAKFSVAPVTVLIGPQGSGKSVTSKLTYFFLDMLIRQFGCAEKGLTLEDFKRDCSRQFKVWFPAAAWGAGRFNINFSNESFTVRVLRRMSKGAVTDDVSITFSDFFSQQYRELLDSFGKVSRSPPADSDLLIRQSLDASWKVREQSEKLLAKELGSSYVRSQIFVPAGRAFFTSIGRLVAAIEQGSSLDPVTIRFAKLFASIRDFSSRGYFMSTDRNESNNSPSVMNSLFGGEIKFDNELEYVLAADGRKIPFNALSSGQQELLPMWLLMDYYTSRLTNSNRGSDLFYIEEPEAHLFPHAQSQLMDFLIGTVASRKAGRGLILTTHSPYILSKLNTYLKAGALGASRRNASRVAEIVPRDCWLQSQNIQAYAIESGTLISLIDDDGLIDSSYIDGVSQDVANTFEALLDIQYPESA